MILKLLVFTLIYVRESKISEILLIGFTFDKKEAFTADQPALIHMCLISIKWLVSDNMDHISIIEEGSKGPYTRAINVLVKLRNAPFEYLSRHSNFGKILFSLVLFVLYNAYLIGCIVRKVQYIYQDSGLLETVF